MSESLDSDNRPFGEDGFIYGFSYFIQKRDVMSKRGYQQVVLLLTLRSIIYSS